MIPETLDQEPQLKVGGGEADLGHGFSLEDGLHVIAQSQETGSPLVVTELEQGRVASLCATQAKQSVASVLAAGGDLGRAMFGLGRRQLNKHRIGSPF